MKDVVTIAKRWARRLMLFFGAPLLFAVNVWLICLVVGRLWGLDPARVLEIVVHYAGALARLVLQPAPVTAAAVLAALYLFRGLIGRLQSEADPILSLSIGRREDAGPAVSA